MLFIFICPRSASQYQKSKSSKSIEKEEEKAKRFLTLVWAKRNRKRISTMDLYEILGVGQHATIAEVIYFI